MDSSRGVKTLNEESMLIIILAFLFLLFASMNVKYGHCFVAGNNDMDVVA